MDAGFPMMPTETFGIFENGASILFLTFAFFLKFFLHFLHIKLLLHHILPDIFHVGSLKRLNNSNGK